MKTIFTFSLFLMMSVLVNSQDCDFEINQKDKFSGKVVKLINPVTIAEKLKVSSDLKFVKITWAMKQNGDQLSALLEWRLSKGYVAMNGLAGTSLSVLLENNEVLELKMTAPLPSTIKRGSKYYSQSEFRITTDDFIKLSLYKISDIKVNAMINPFEIPVDPEAQPVVLEKTKCFTIITEEKKVKTLKEI
jgi:hypothetical protein